MRVVKDKASTFTLSVEASQAQDQPLFKEDLEDPSARAAVESTPEDPELTFIKDTTFTAFMEFMESEPTL